MLDSARGGTGLGLNLSQRLAWIPGGEISATWELGVGTRFVVRLPVEEGTVWLTAFTPRRKEQVDRA